MDCKKCCGTCKHHAFNGEKPEDWFCDNTGSDFYSEWTDYGDSCSGWEAH